MKLHVLTCRIYIVYLHNPLCAFNLQLRLDVCVCVLLYLLHVCAYLCPAYVIQLKPPHPHTHIDTVVLQEKKTANIHCYLNTRADRQLNNNYFLEQ